MTLPSLVYVMLIFDLKINYLNQVICYLVGLNWFPSLKPSKQTNLTTLSWFKPFSQHAFTFETSTVQG